MNHPADCGCCTGLRAATPTAIANRPGLPAIAYRAGDWAALRQTMLAGLAGHPGTAALRTRSDADPTIALIDAWAVVGDVLTFAVERTANEHYLPTATERRSVDALAQLIGYRLQPGLAASTWLAFTLETAPGAPRAVTVPAGTRVQSVPGPGELPQTFETVEAVAAHAGWNLPLPRRSAELAPSGDTGWLAGTALDLNPGDVLLFVAGDWQLGRVVEVEPDAAAARTRVRWDPPLGELVGTAAILRLGQRASLFGHNAPDPRLFSPEVRDGLPDGTLSNDDWAFAEIIDRTVFLDTQYRGLEPGGLVVLSGPATDPVLATVEEVIDAQQDGYGLSGRVTGLVLGVDDDVLAPFGGQHTRDTTVLLDSVRFATGGTPIAEPVLGATVTLDSPPPTDPAGRTVVVGGRLPRATRNPDHSLLITADDGRTRQPGVDDALVVLAVAETSGGARWRLRTADGFEGSAVGDLHALAFRPAPADDPQVAEPVVVERLAADGVTLVLADPLRRAYDRSSAHLWGNVAAATHGESVLDEVLGSGDAGRAFQAFTLRRSPLTQLRDAAGRSTSTLTVRIGGVAWTEVPSLFGHGPPDRVYVTRTGDDGATVIRFGDGVTGARLPTGRDNVRADYRFGSGPAGHLAAGQLSLLMTRPLGVRAVTNPIAPAGAVAAQAGADARQNAPRTVSTLGRIVSLRDYQDFARDYPGVAKAAAVRTWDGVRGGVLVTVAGVDGAPVEPGDPVHEGLVAAVAAAADRRVPVLVKSYWPALFRLRATLRAAAGYRPEDVLAAVRAALAAEFSFGAGDFGRLVALSSIYRVLHSVAGVDSADIDQLHRGEVAELAPFLRADAPVDGDPPSRAAAELLTLDRTALEALEVLG